MTLRQNVNSHGELIRDAFVQHEPVDFICDDDGMTRQEFADECDINVLLARYERTGALPVNNRGEPQYLDVSDVPDLMRAHQIMEAAQSSFMQLPATVRREFDNDPLQFMEYAQDPENVDKLREWGLAAPKPSEPPPSVPPVAATPPAENTKG